MSPSHDVVLVGGGGAGLRAAIAIADSHPALNVAVVSKVYPMRSHTVSAEGGTAGVIAPGDSFDEHAFDTIAAATGCRTRTPWKCSCAKRPKNCRAFILRELSCLFVAWFVVYLLVLVRAVNQGEAAYQGFLAWSAGPSVLLLNVVSFAFIIYHAITFFIAAPQALVVHVGGKRLPSALIGGAHYLALAAVSAIVAWVLLGGPMIKRHPEPLLWMLFSAGGVLSALLMPVLIALFGLAFPLGWITPPGYERMPEVVSHPLTRLVLFALLMLSLFH